MDLAAMRTGTNQMLDEQKKASQDYVGFWSRAVETRIAKEAELDVAANAKSLARYQALKKNKADVDRQWMEEQAAMADIARGSGGYGSMPTGGSGRRSNGIGGMAGAQIAGDLAGGSGWKTAAEGGLFTVGMLHLQHAINEILEGKTPTALAKIPRAILHVGKFLSEFAEVLGVTVAVVGASWEAVKLTRAIMDAKNAHTKDVFSRADLAQQTGKLGGSLDSKITELENDGRISTEQAERLRSMSSGGTSENLRTAQRFVMQEEAKLAEEKAAAEQKSADAADYARRAAEGKAIAEKEAADKLKEQEKLSREYGKLAREAHNIETEGGRVDSVVPTVADLAGRDFSKKLNKDYGAGGKFDLGKGNGVYGDAARESELAGKQMAWDLTYGNGRYVVGADGVGHFTGQAEVDRKRKIAADNMLGAAGLDTPAMKFEAMKQHLADIRQQMVILNQKASDDGIVIKTND